MPESPCEKPGGLHKFVIPTLGGSDGRWDRVTTGLAGRQPSLIGKLQAQARASASQNKVDGS